MIGWEFFCSSRNVIEISSGNQGSIKDSPCRSNQFSFTIFFLIENSKRFRIVEVETWQVFQLDKLTSCPAGKLPHGARTQFCNFPVACYRWISNFASFPYFCSDLNT